MIKVHEWEQGAERRSWRRRIRRWLPFLAGASLLAVPLACSDDGSWAEGEASEWVSEGLEAPVTVTFQQGVAPSASYAGSSDATLHQVNPTANSGTATTCEADGDDGAGVDKSCIVRWALTGIPSGSVVTAASVTFQVVNPTNSTYDIYEVKRSWSESQVTWNNATSAVAWSTAGVQGTNDRGSLLGTITGATGARTVNLNTAGIALVQSWVDGATNGGILVAHPTSTDGIDFASVQHATASYRPILSVTYQAPSSGGTGGAGSGGSGSGGTSSSPVTAQFRRGSLPNSSYTGATDATLAEGNPTANSGAATTCEVDGDDGAGVDKACVVRWDISSIPAGSTVQSASMTLQVVDGTSNTYDIYGLARSWSESQVTWNNATSSSPWGTPGALATSDRGALVGSIGGGTGSRTVTLNSAGVALVQSWVDGATNRGFIVAHRTNTDGLDFASSESSTLSSRPTFSVTYLPPGSSGGTGGSSGETSTEPNLLVAFIGDQGNGSNASAVLNLIKNEGAAAVVHNGDFDYANSPSSYENRINSILGANYPYFAVIGNHDAPAWGGTSGYASYIDARVARVPDMNCTGENGVKANCYFRGLHLVQSCIGTSELRSSCGKDSTEHVNFIRDSLAADNSIWSVCSWHKNQRAMQVGTKSDEVGWNAYRECQSAGAIVSTGHEHSYSRTLTLTNVGASGHGAVGAYDVMELRPGRNFVFVSGLGGVGIRAFSTTYHSSDTWWSSYYTSDRWYRNGVMQSGVGNYGALFVRFHVNGDPRLATAYFKDISGRVVDTFTIRAQ